MAPTLQRVRSIRKTIMYTTLVLFIFIVVIGIYLVINDQYDEGIWNVSNKIQLITQNVTLNEYKLPIDIQTLSQKLNLPTTIDTQTTTESPLNIDTLELIPSNNSIHHENLTQNLDKEKDIINIPTQSTPTHLSYTQQLTKHILNAEATNGHIPHSWEDLNNQQFCSIHKSDPKHQKFLETIYDLQFTRSCNINEHKFLIYDVNLENARGLGASLFGYFCRYLTVALQLNRTLLFHGQFDWTIGAEYCNNTNGMECYFLPLSHCDPRDILEQVSKTDTTEYHEGKNPENCRFGTNGIDTECEYKVIYINKRRTPKPMLQKGISDFGVKNFRMKIFELESIMIGFFLRPQPNVKQIIYEKILNSVNKSLDGKENIDDINASQYISMPIRASDKCRNIHNVTQKRYKHRPEITCFTPIEYMFMMNVLKIYSKMELKGVILTSEDNSFLEQVVYFMKNDNRSLVKHWNVILNTEDYSVGEGTTTYRRTKKLYNVSLDDKLGTSLGTDHIVSALSSLILQVHLETEYLLWLYESSWTELMWNWLAILNCNVMAERHKAEYNKCCKLLTSGYIHTRKHNRIELPPDIYQQVHDEQGLDEDEFHDKYGIWYAENTMCHIQGSKKRVAK